MAFIKEETEDISISEQFSLKNEDAEDHTGWFISNLLLLIKCRPLNKVIKIHMRQLIKADVWYAEWVTS